MTTKKLSAIILAVVLLSRMMIRIRHELLKFYCTTRTTKFSSIQLYNSLAMVWYSEVPPGYLILVLNFLFCLKKMCYEILVLFNGGILQVKVLQLYSTSTW